MPIVIEETDNREICMRCADIAGISKGGAWSQVDLEPGNNPLAAYRHAVLTFPDGTPDEVVRRARAFFESRVNEWGKGHNHPRWVSGKNATDAALIFEGRLEMLNKNHPAPTDGSPDRFAVARKRIAGMIEAAWAEADAKGGPA
jgi:hypothetical protein